MHTNQGEKYSVQIASHQAELRREEKFTDRKSLNISSLHTDYLNLDSSSCFGINSERAHAIQTKCTFCGGTYHSAKECLKRIRKEKEKAPAVNASKNRQTKRTPRKCFRCGSEDHFIAKFPKPPKNNDKRRKKVSFNEKVNRACDNDENNSNQKIYISMAHMSGNDKFCSESFGDSSQLTN